MASSLQELLVEEGFERHKKNVKTHQKKVKFRDRRAQDESIVLPIYVCREHRRSVDVPKPKSDKAPSHNGSIVSSSTRRAGSDSGKSMIGAIDEGFFVRNEPALDEVAIRAVVSILGGYIGQYLREKKFRETMRAKCYSCFTRNKDSDNNGELENMKLGIENVERLVEDKGPGKELNLKLLQYCIRLLSSSISTLNFKSSRNGSISGLQNSHLAACAQLYLSILYKMHKSDRLSARHLLQVFCDSPFIARTHLLPELWEHLFLPHLLHLKIWYNEEIESLSDSMYPDKEIKVKALDKAYNDQMDIGTEKFALYYKEWLKDGAKAPAIPSVPLPLTLDHAPQRRRHSDSFTLQPSNKSSLYRAIFGPVVEKKSMELKDRHGDLNYHSCSREQKKFSVKEDKLDMETRSLGSQRSSTLSHRKVQAEPWLDDKKSGYFSLLNCRSDMAERGVCKDNTLLNVSIKEDRNRRISLSNELSRAARTICTSESLTECETAIRLMTKVMINSPGDPAVENAISKSHVIEAILEVLSASSDDEILELAISILAQITKKKGSNEKIILNLDPQLEIFMRLLRDNSLFLKASVLLYLLKPKAKQMIAMEWIPLILRVLEFGDLSQTLFTIQCSPQVAAYYFLDQLLNCFDEDKNIENARYVVSLGGLNLLIRRMEIGDVCEKNKAASIIYRCIQAEGSCRHYLAKNLNKESLISLLILRDRTTQDQAFALLTELFCIHRHHERTEFLKELMNGWGRMNTLHMLLVYLQKAQPEDRPVVAAILLQLDLLGDPYLLLAGDRSECSVYRDEAIEEIVKALDCQVLNEKVQEQSARALLILACQFSYTGEPIAEKWLLRQAGFDENSLESFSSNRVAVNNFTDLVREDEMAQNWQRTTAMVLLKRGKRNFLVALSDSIANGIPCLAKASLVTVSRISSFLQPSEERSLHSLACSILMPQLLEALNYDKTMEERILASFSLLNFLKGSDFADSLKTLITKEFIDELDKLSQVTWTAKELISVITNSSKN